MISNLILILIDIGPPSSCVCCFYPHTSKLGLGLEGESVSGAINRRLLSVQQQQQKLLGQLSCIPEHNSVENMASPKPPANLLKSSSPLMIPSLF